MIRIRLLLGILLLTLYLPIDSKCFGQASNLPDTLSVSFQNMNADQKIEYLGSWGWKLRETNVEQSASFTKIAYELAIEKENHLWIAKIGNYLGAIYLHYLFDHRNAIAPLHNALENASIIHDTTQLAYAYNNLGDAYYLSSNIPKAKEYADLSLAYFKSLNDADGIAYSLVNKGLVSRLENNFEMAVGFFHRAYDLASETMDTGRMAYCQLEIAITKFQQDKLDEALRLFQLSYDTHLSLNNLSYAAICAKGIADTYYQLNLLDKSKEYYKKALELNEIRDNRFNQIGILSGLGRLYGKIGKTQEGEQLLKEALSLAKDLGIGSKIKECFIIMSEFYRNSEDWEKASIKSFQYINAADSLFKIQQIEALQESTERLNSSFRIHEFETEAVNRNKRFVYLLIISLLLAIMLIILIVNLKKRSVTNKQLQAMNESKDKLFSIISHDLKNPFVALSQYIDLLKEGEMTESMKTWFINDLDKKASATQDLLENLLNLSASKTGKLSFTPAGISSIDLFQSILKQSKVQIDQKEIVIELDLDGSSIYGDLNMMKMIFRNLLSNAIKFSHNKGRIILASRTTDKGTEVTIRDFGIGMDRKTADSLFQADFSSSTQGTSGEKGTGIGLSLCKEFVDKHMGHIEVSSTKNSGSTMTVFLPSS